MLRTVSAILFTLPLAGCFLTRDVVNEPLRAERIARLEPGKSTANDVLAVLGAPTEVVQLGKRSAWRYDHTITKRAALVFIVAGFVNTDTQQDRVWLFFDEADRLIHAGATLSAEHAEYSMPWSDLHE
jgi:hypothetical protein